jgi:outer membrane cobalamin receptor
MEVGYNLRRKKTTWLASVYMQDMSNVISRFNRVDTNGVNFGTWENIADVTSLGIELIANTEILPWWSLNVSGNGYRKQNNGTNLEGQLRNTALSWSLRAMSSMKFKNGYNIQISGFYRAPEQFIQGDFSGFSFVDVSMKKSVLKNKGSVTLNLRDAFDTREFNFSLVGPTFTQERYRKRESRNLFVTFSYNFGKLESGRDRRKGRSGGGEGGFEGGGMDMD